MKAEELRIGNLVKQGQVGALDNLQAWTFTDGVVLPVDYKELTPIPLTEEWLVRFGFEKSAFNENVYSNKSIILDKRKLGWLLCDNSIDNLKHIEHVHQLQNLYFALTGEELTLNETI